MSAVCQSVLHPVTLTCSSITRCWALQWISGDPLIPWKDTSSCQIGRLAMHCPASVAYLRQRLSRLLCLQLWPVVFSTRHTARRECVVIHQSAVVGWQQGPSASILRTNARVSHFMQRQWCHWLSDLTGPFHWCSLGVDVGLLVIADLTILLPVLLFLSLDNSLVLLLFLKSSCGQSLANQSS